MSKLSDLQEQYNAMVEQAMRSMDNGVPLHPKFERELTALTKLIKSLGGKVN